MQGGLPLLCAKQSESCCMQVSQTMSEEGVQVVNATLALVASEPQKEVQEVRLWFP